MKPIYSQICLIILFVVITKQDLLSQDWSLNGNNLAGNEKLGSSNNTDLKYLPIINAA